MTENWNNTYIRMNSRTKVTDRNFHNGVLNFIYFAVVQTNVAYRPALFHVLNIVRA